MVCHPDRSGACVLTFSVVVIQRNRLHHPWPSSGTHGKSRDQERTRPNSPHEGPRQTCQARAQLAKCGCTNNRTQLEPCLSIPIRSTFCQRHAPICVFHFSDIVTIQYARADGIPDIADIWTSHRIAARINYAGIECLCNANIRINFGGIAFSFAFVVSIRHSCAQRERWECCGSIVTCSGGSSLRSTTTTQRQQAATAVETKRWS